MLCSRAAIPETKCYLSVPPYYHFAASLIVTDDDDDDDDEEELTGSLPSGGSSARLCS